MSYIDSSGIYHKEDAPMQDALPRPTSVYKQSDHDRQRADHKMELVKPWNDDGTPSQEFIQAYPTEAKEVYKFVPTDEEIARGQR